MHPQIDLISCEYCLSEVEPAETCPKCGAWLPEVVVVVASGRPIRRPNYIIRELFALMVGDTKHASCYEMTRTVGGKRKRLERNVFWGTPHE